MLMRIAQIVLLPLCIVACGGEPARFPWLDELNSEDARPSGERLMALPEGLHLLEKDASLSKNITIGIHGYESGGIEWVYPLKTLDDPDTRGCQTKVLAGSGRGDQKAARLPG